MAGEGAVSNVRVGGRCAAEIAERSEKRQTPQNIITILITQSAHIAEMIGIHVVEFVRFSAAIGANPL